MSGGMTEGSGQVSRRGWIMFVAMSVIWGLPYLLIKVAVGGVPVPVLVLARVGLGAAVLLPIALRRGQLAAIWAVWPWLGVLAVVEIIMPWYALSEAERGISSSLTGLLIASVPIIIAVLSLFVRGGDRLSPVRWVGLLIGLAGVALLAGPHLVGSSAGGGAARAVAAVLFVPLCYAARPLIANRKLADGAPDGGTRRAGARPRTGSGSGVWLGVITEVCRHGTWTDFRDHESSTSRAARIAKVIDLKAARQDPQGFRAALARRGAAEDFDKLLAADASWREHTERAESLRAEQKKASRGTPSSEELAQLKDLSARIEMALGQQSDAARLRDEILGRIPNLPDPTAADGTG